MIQAHLKFQLPFNYFTLQSTLLQQRSLMFTSASPSVLTLVKCSTPATSYKPTSLMKMMQA